MDIKNQETNYRKMMIRTQRENARAAVDGFKWSRSKEVQDEFRVRAMQERHLIK